MQGNLARFAAAASMLAALACALPATAAEPAVSAKQLVAQAESNYAQRQAMIEEGRKATFFCTNCHGETGNSRYPEVPNLAGQHPAYVLAQMDAFLSNRRKDAFMQGLMKVLNERERAAVAVFYANSTVKPAAPTPGPQAQRGGELFAKICARCHQADARGAETFPRLAGQQQEYLRINLRRYLTQSGERLYTPMTAAVTQLGVDNIEAVTQYLSSLE